MAKVKFLDGSELKLKKEDEARVFRAVTRGTLPFRLLPSGLAINFANVAAIDFGAPPSDPKRVQLEPERQPQGMQPQKVTKPTQDEKKIPVGMLKSLLDDSGLKPTEFAGEIGYSFQALRLALKEGRISKEFSDAVVKRFLPKERWAEFGVEVTEEDENKPEEVTEVEK